MHCRHSHMGGVVVMAVLLLVLALGCQTSSAAQSTGTSPGAPAVGRKGKGPSSERRPVIPPQPSARSVRHDRVCFMNDRYMGAPQIPVVVAGRTYYGCCAGCAKRLRTDRTKRVARDPHSGREVDKATAFIALVPGGNGRVVYFESAASHAAFVVSHQSGRKP